MAEFNSYIEHPEIGRWREICVNEGELCRYAKGEEFVSIGKVARYIGFVKSGTLKYVVRDSEGNDHVGGFASESEFVADWPFTLHGEKAKLAIVANSQCEIYRFPAKEIVKRMKKDPSLAELVARSTELVFYQTYERYIDLYCKSPEERYADMVARYPDIFDIYTLKDIASFLKITPTHLSRIRKKIE